MTVTVVAAEPSGLALMVADLIEQNLARDPARRALLRPTVAVLDAPDADVTVFLRIEPDDVRIGDGDVPDAHLRIRAASERLLDLTTAPLRFGLPDPLRPEGRAIVADLLRRSHPDPRAAPSPAPPRAAHPAPHRGRRGAALVTSAADTPHRPDVPAGSGRSAAALAPHACSSRS